MYPILSFPLIAKADLDIGDLLALFRNWAERSEHYDFGDTQMESLLGSPCCRERFSAGKASLELIRHTDGTGSYAALTLEKPDETANLFWRLQCVYAGREKEEGTFYIDLLRCVYDAGQPADLTLIPKMPVIAKRLLESKTARRAGDSPVVTIHAGFQRKYPDFCRKLRANLFPIAAVRVMEESDAEEFDIAYPMAELDWTYTIDDTDSAEDQEITINDAILELYRAVTEVQSGRERPMTWEKLCQLEPLSQPGEADQGDYCYMTQAMADRMREARRRQGISQMELARRARTTGLMISRLETIRIQRVQRALLSRIEQALSLPAGALTIPQAPEVPEARPAGVHPAPPPREGVQEKAGYCRRCGQHLYEDSRFCSACGTQVLP
mgnify:FL=1